MQQQKAFDAQAMQQQKAFDAQAMQQQRTLSAVIERMERLFSAMGATPAAPPASTAEFVTNSLSTRLPEFTYDPDNGCTFDVWYNRYEDIIANDGSTLDTAAYARFTNHILPNKTFDVSLDESEKTLKELFGNNTSVFARHYAYLWTRCSGRTIRDYAGLVNRRHKMAKFNDVTPEQMKWLVWICGLANPEDTDIRARALRKTWDNPQTTLIELSAKIQQFMDIRQDAKLLGNQPSSPLSGLDWIAKNEPLFRRLTEEAICNISVSTLNTLRTSLTKQLQKQFTIVFAPGLGRCVKSKAHLTLKPNAKPVFRKARPVPYAALVSHRRSTDWWLLMYFRPSTTQIGPHLSSSFKRKTDQSDSAQTTNDAFEQHQHPLPTPDDIFSKMNGGHYFSQLDFAEAYLQLEMDEDSRPLLTINTHRGLYRFNRLPFAVKPAPGIFRQYIDPSLLDWTELPHTWTTIVTGRTIDEHNTRLNAVFQRIPDYRFRVRLEK
ncbi:hypothetical protein Y032_0079g1259 [Ancylostoma ceylanicum]|uniref:Reverse transcriptase domain-containing protein n=3 Tax=Ancylostoma ceylanicum TaxID=53326 RepID=A0A016TT09_9BILA|nr:hypothetical protein Y032_0079g1259 [Ancylostoma ceylanicum]